MASFRPRSVKNNKLIFKSFLIIVISRKEDSYTEARLAMPPLRKVGEFANNRAYASQTAFRSRMEKPSRALLDFHTIAPASCSGS